MAKEEFNLLDNNYYKKSLFSIDKLACEKEFWSVDETISELSYLTHDYFRYYGKFPSKIGKLILEDLLNENKICKETDFILDNYAGSGTSLVEAKLAGVDSIGMDINPFAVLACNVKTYNYDVNILKDQWDIVLREISKYSMLYRADIIGNLVTDYDTRKKNKIDSLCQQLIQDSDFTKWFSETVIRDLVIIKIILLENEYSRYREFFDLGFFAIIRRVSRAHDAEVRPHVNKKKRERDVIDAYNKKISDMINKMNMWNEEANNEVYSFSYLSSNADNKNYHKIIDREKRLRGKNLGAVISHPPYLNCFDYIPVYKLKFLWADGFDEIFGQLTYDEIKKQEIKSYPVNNHNAIDRYFEHNYSVYKNVFDSLRSGGYCCIVIGDCTVKKELFSIHKSFIVMMEEIGFTLKKMAYRSTSYGMGRYAYNFRAEYSENENGKQDAILFFEK